MLFELFSDIFTIRRSWLSSVDARVKLITVMAALLLTLLAQGPLYPAALFVISVAGAWAISVPLRHIAVRFIAPVGVALMILPLKTFMTTGSVLWSVQLGGMVFTATREGLAMGIIIAAKTVGAVGASLALSFVTPASEVFRALMWMGAPRGWIEVAMMAYRFSFDMFERAGDLGSAQMTRLGYSSPGRALSSAGVLAGAVALGAMEKAARVEEALRVRGYRGGDLPYSPTKPLGARDAGAIAGALAALCALFLLCEAL